MEQKTRKRKKKLLNLLIALTAAAMVVCAVMLALPLLEYRAGNALYLELAEYAPTPAPETEAAAIDAPAAAPAPEFVYTPDFKGLAAVNPDIAGWLESPGTVIRYPVVRGADNSYYLTHLFNKTKNRCGTLFIDCANAEGFSDENTIIYGHHMKNGAMFASLVNYQEQAYYDAHPVLSLSAPGGNYRVELFAAYITPGRADNAVYTRNFADAAAFSRFLAEAKAQSDFASDVSVTPEDHILTLSTCTYEYDEARYVVLGKLVPAA